MLEEPGGATPSASSLEPGVAGDEPKAGRDPFASSAIQRETLGSYSSDDPDKPLWETSTEFKAAFDYRFEDGRYSWSMLKGLRADGRKAFLAGRRWQGSMGDYRIALQDDPRRFYGFTGLELYERGAGDSPELLYRVDELTRAMRERAEETVFIAEGEKDVDALIHMGLIATTNANGAGKWKGNFNRRFAGRDVVILADNDERGRDHAASISEGLRR